MHRLAAFAVLVVAAGCLREKVQYCKNGAYCPEPLTCTENPVEPFCGESSQVDQCLGKADESPCMYRTEKNGYCQANVCTQCDPNLAFCRYDEWTAMNPVIGGVRVSVELTSAWASATGLYAVGRGGTVIHWDGRAWSALPTVRSDADYVTMWGFDANNLYAATAGTYAGTRIFRFDGTAWLPQLPAPASFVFGMWGATPNLVFSVGQNGEVGRYDGTWSYTSPSASALNGVFGTDTTSAVAVGQSGTAIRYESGTWSADPTGTTYVLRDVAGAGGTELAVGRLSLAINSGVAVRHQNNAWTDVTSGLPTGTLDLKAVWVVSPTRAYAVGDSGILHYDGATWTAVVPNVVLSGIVGTPTNLFAVGAAGTVLRLSL